MNNRSFNSGRYRPRWDWFSLQLSDNTEVMFYILRDDKGKKVSVSSGTFVYSDNRTKHLKLSDVKIEVINHWKSPVTRGVYPMGWRFVIAGEKLELMVQPVFEAQELRTPNSTGISYWEGAVNVTGKRNGKLVTGRGYVEMTGYAPMSE